jgi:hypothetical protein
VSELGSFFVTIGSKLDSKGFKAARASIDKIAKAGLIMGAALTGVAIKAAKAASVQESATNALAQAMVTAGTFTEDAMEHNLAYAASLQKVTTFGDEMILGVQRMLTNFGIEGQELDDLTRATLDLAAAKGMDLKAAGDLVAKSVGSSTNALTRYGITVEGAAGSTDRARMAVQNISKIFGGAAAADALTFEGQIKQLNNAVGDLWEKVGEFVIPVFAELTDVIKNQLVPAFDKWLSSADNLDGGVARIGNALEWVLKIVVGAVGFFDLLRQAIVNTFKIGGQIMASFGAILKGVFTGDFNLAKMAQQELKKVVSDAFSDMGDSVIKYGETIKKINKLDVKFTKRAQDRKTAIVKNAIDRQRKIAAEDLEKEKEQNDEKYTDFEELHLAMNEFMAEQRETQKQEKLDQQAEDAVAVQEFVGAVSDTYSDYTDLRTQQIRNNLQTSVDSENQQYETRKAQIVKNVKDEGERDRQLDELEKGHSARLDNLRSHASNEERKARSKMKPLMIAQAIANTAVGATKALATGGFPMGAILAALATAAGMMQVAKIKAQKFAQGGLVSSATPAIFGEAGPELALPLKSPNAIEALSSALRKAMGAGGMGTGGNIYVTVPPISTRGEARRMGDIIGTEIIKKIKRNRKL